MPYNAFSKGLKYEHFSQMENTRLSPERDSQSIKENAHTDKSILPSRGKDSSTSTPLLETKSPAFTLFIWIFFPKPFLKYGKQRYCKMISQYARSSPYTHPLK